MLEKNITKNPISIGKVMSSEKINIPNIVEKIILI